MPIQLAIRVVAIWQIYILAGVARADTAGTKFRTPGWKYWKRAALSVSVRAQESVLQCRSNRHKLDTRWLVTRGAAGVETDGPAICKRVTCVVTHCEPSPPLALWSSFSTVIEAAKVRSARSKFCRRLRIEPTDRRLHGVDARSMSAYRTSFNSYSPAVKYTAVGCLCTTAVLGCSLALWYRSRRVSSTGYSSLISVTRRNSQKVASSAGKLWWIQAV